MKVQLLFQRKCYCFNVWCSWLMFLRSGCILSLTLFFLGNFLSISSLNFFYSWSPLHLCHFLKNSIHCGEENETISGKAMPELFKEDFLKSTFSCCFSSVLDFSWYLQTRFFFMFTKIYFCFRSFWDNSAVATL